MKENKTQKNELRIELPKGYETRELIVGVYCWVKSLEEGHMDASEITGSLNRAIGNRGGSKDMFTKAEIMQTIEKVRDLDITINTGNEKWVENHLIGGYLKTMPKDATQDDITYNSPVPWFLLLREEEREKMIEEKFKGMA